MNMKMISDIQERIAPMLGKPDFGIDLNVDIVSRPILEKDTFSPRKFSPISD
jgi:hypothetical protein